MIGPRSNGDPPRADDPFGGQPADLVVNGIYQAVKRAVRKDDGESEPATTEPRRCPPNYHWDETTGGCVPDLADSRPL
jgi:hypothetical protein